MSAPWRLLVDDGVGAAEGLALDEALMGRYARGEPERAPTLRLYSYRDHCALVGRFQNLEAELDLAACRRTGTEVSRRLTGGGAIIMGSGQLGIAYLDRAPAAGRPREIIEELSAAIAAGLSRLGIDASFRGKNDLEVGGRKIAGLGLYVDGSGAMLFHASVLAHLDVPLMVRLLRIPAAKLADQAEAAVTGRITTVATETGSPHDAASLRPVMAEAFAASFNVVLEPATPDEKEQARADELAAARYGSQGWLSERTPAGDAGGAALLKTPEGLARIYLTTHGDLVKSALVVGDFNELPPELAAMESALRWRRLDGETVVAVVAASGAAEALRVTPETLAGAVIEAGLMAREKVAGKAPPGAGAGLAEGGADHRGLPVGPG